MKRRDFVKVSAVTAAGMIAGCNKGSQDTQQAAARPAAPPPPPAGFDVIVHFSGLFALAATSAFDKACVLFLDANKASIDPHFAVLKLAPDNHGTETPDDKDPYTNVDIWKLDKCHVDFGLTGSCTPMTTAAVACPKIDKKAKDPHAEWRDTRWIAELPKALKSGDGKVNPDFVKPGDLTSTVVQTRIALAGGAIGAGSPRDVNAQTAKFTLIDGDTNHTQSMSDVVEFHVSNVTALQITLTPFNGTAARTIALQTPIAGRAVHVWLENLADPAATMPNLKQHFKALSDLRKSAAKRPYPADGVNCETGKSQPEFPVYCPPALIEYTEV